MPHWCSRSPAGGYPCRQIPTFGGNRAQKRLFWQRFPPHTLPGDRREYLNLADNTLQRKNSLTSNRWKMQFPHMTSGVDKSSKNGSTPPLSHCPHSQASLCGRWRQWYDSVPSCLADGLRKRMASAPLWSQLAQLVLPIIPPGKLVHSPAHERLPRVWKRNRAQEKACGKHSPVLTLSQIGQLWMRHKPWNWARVFWHQCVSNY